MRCQQSNGASEEDFGILIRAPNANNKGLSGFGLFLTEFKNKLIIIVLDRTGVRVHLACLDKRIEKEREHCETLTLPPNVSIGRLNN